MKKRGKKFWGGCHESPFKEKHKRPKQGMVGKSSEV